MPNGLKLIRLLNFTWPSRNKNRKLLNEMKTTSCECSWRERDSISLLSEWSIDRLGGLPNRDSGACRCFVAIYQFSPISLISDPNFKSGGIFSPNFFRPAGKWSGFLLFLSLTHSLTLVPMIASLRGSVPATRASSALCKDNLAFCFVSPLCSLAFVVLLFSFHHNKRINTKVFSCFHYKQMAICAICLCCCRMNSMHGWQGSLARCSPHIGTHWCGNDLGNQSRLKPWTSLLLFSFFPKITALRDAIFHYSLLWHDK